MKAADKRQKLWLFFQDIWQVLLYGECIIIFAIIIDDCYTGAGLDVTTPVFITECPLTSGAVLADQGLRIAVLPSITLFEDHSFDAG